MVGMINGLIFACYLPFTGNSDTNYISIPAKKLINKINPLMEKEKKVTEVKKKRKKRVDRQHTPPVCVEMYFPMRLTPSFIKALRPEFLGPIGLKHNANYFSVDKP